MSTNVNIWSGNPGVVSGSTPFGYYDNESLFQSDAPKVANYIVSELGYPTIDVEISSGSIYTCFEQSITTYSSLVNSHRIKENLLDIQGASTSSNLTHKPINSNLGQTIRLADDYGSEAGVGGTIEYKSGSITTIADQQVYNLNTLWADVFESGSKIEVKRIYHYAPPAGARFFDPYIGTGLGTYNLLKEFGWTNMSPGTTFVMMPLFEDILRMNAIELHDTIRRSNYSFELVNNKLKLFPIPRYSNKVWFDYILTEDRDSLTRGTTNGTVSDMSNAPFNNMLYSQINHPGKNWIIRYTLAAVKVIVGLIRRKYSVIPIPDGDISLDGDTLVSEGKEEKKDLIEELQNDLEKVSKTSLTELKKTEAENLDEILSHIPLDIYIG